MSASLLQRLIEAGTPADLIAEVAILHGEVKALEKALEEKPRERTKGAIRTERWRQNKALCASQSVTCDAEVTNVTQNVTQPAPSPSPNENLNPNPTPTRESITPAREEPVDLPDGATPEQWGGFVEMRRRIRKPLTARAHQLALRKLWRLAEAGHPPGEVLDQSTLNDWQDLYPIKDNDNAKRRHRETYQTGDADRGSVTNRAFEAAYADLGVGPARGAPSAPWDGSGNRDPEGSGIRTISPHSPNTTPIRGDAYAGSGSLRLVGNAGG